MHNYGIPSLNPPNVRVRGILLTGRDSMMMIKRIKPNKPEPYWVAPGGGVEFEDESPKVALVRELREELGATIKIINHAFTLYHTMGGKNLQEHFFVCQLMNYDISLRNGPEFNDPIRGEYIPDDVPLTTHALKSINMKTPQLRDWLLLNLGELKAL
jgi:8-oxo-dGTP pyrophosphatase MutT (NUDIX family)